MLQAAPASSSARPWSVTLAGYLLFAVALTELTQAILGLSAYDREAEAYIVAVRKAADQEHKVIGDPTSVVHSLITAQIVVALVVSALFLVMGIFVLRGRRGMRITAWAVTGLGVLCSGVGLAGGGLTGSAAGADGTTTVDLPGWLVTAQHALSVVDVLAFVAIIVLLALPVSHPYFRKAFQPDPPLPG
jgi:hypothetical protein